MNVHFSIKTIILCCIRDKINKISLLAAARNPFIISIQRKAAKYLKLTTTGTAFTRDIDRTK